MLTASLRAQRQHDGLKSDQRRWSQRDRDRLLYAEEFRRLGKVTQVVSADERGTFHNRLTHTLEVAQIGRRIAERLVGDFPESNVVKLGLDSKLDIIDPDVVEAACLAHDLGHPPFGHIAEDELDKLARYFEPGSERVKESPDKSIQAQEFDGFEGNAQSFRIVTRLSVHGDYGGLNLSRATLNAILKYPWFRGESPSPKKAKKFGAYRQDRDAFLFAREESVPNKLSLEGYIMDYADAVAYAIHDLDDFQKAGLIRFTTDEFERFFEQEKEHFLPHGFSEKKALKQLRNLLKLLGLDEAYIGSRQQRVKLHKRNAELINDYVTSTKIQMKGREVIWVPVPEKDLEIDFLKRILWVKVIQSPQLATQQEGQRRIIRHLFKFYLNGIQNRDERIIPQLYFKEFGSLGDVSKTIQPTEVRLAVDFVSRLSESQAQAMYLRITQVAT